jgi:hypothetical protein
LKQKRREEDILFKKKTRQEMGCFSNRYTYGGMVASEVANKITESAIPVL